jgi:hypothetical protein
MVLFMIKEMPYSFEIVPSNGSLWVINTTRWLKKDCKIRITSNDGEKKEVRLLGSIKNVRIDNLKNNKKYHLSIRRADILGRIKYRSFNIFSVPSEKYSKYIVLVGASVGKSWDLNALVSRNNDINAFVGYRGYYKFDKKCIIMDLIQAQIKPDAIIIKECAAYFPRENKSSLAMIEDWVELIIKSGILPLLSTVIPVTKENDVNNGKGRMESINLYNEGIRMIGEKKNIPVIDFQSILSKNNEVDGYLDEKYALEDGLHLTSETYANTLDEVLVNHIKHLSFCLKQAD